MASVTVDVDLSDFDDEEIMEAAVDIVERWAKNPAKVGRHEHETIKALRLALMEPNSDGVLSTAAKLKTPFDLKKLVEDHPELYRFAN